jgi:predicted nucleotidyltransferase
MYLIDTADSILKMLKADLKAALGDKIEDLILFGSYSRGDFKEYSDIDLLILVKGALRREEMQLIDDLVADYSLKHDVVISGLVYPAEIYHQFNTPFLLNVKEDGVSI